MPYKDPKKAKQYWKKYNKEWKINNREKYKKRMTEWQRNNPEKTKKYRDTNYQKHKNKIITQKINANKKRRHIAKLDCVFHYSNGTNCCECCGENHIEFLSIDHISGNGRKHRKEIKEYLPIYLKKNNYPLGFRILCYNCNLAIGFFGYCPHKKGDE